MEKLKIKAKTFSSGSICSYRWLLDMVKSGGKLDVATYKLIEIDYP